MVGVMKISITFAGVRYNSSKSLTLYSRHPKSSPICGDWIWTPRIMTRKAEQGKRFSAITIQGPVYVPFQS